MEKNIKYVPDKVADTGAAVGVDDDDGHENFRSTSAI